MYPTYLTALFLIKPCVEPLTTYRRKETNDFCLCKDFFPPLYIHLIKFHSANLHLITQTRSFQRIHPAAHPLDHSCDLHFTQRGNVSRAAAWWRARNLTRIFSTSFTSQIAFTSQMTFFVPPKPIAHKISHAHTNTHKHTHRIAVAPFLGSDPKRPMHWRTQWYIFRCPCIVGGLFWLHIFMRQQVLLFTFFLIISFGLFIIICRP